MTNDTGTTTTPPTIVATMRHDKLGVTLADGSWIEVEPIPPGYCPHGKYVGGCGIDWMCGPCEFGEGDPTADYYNYKIANHTAAIINATNMAMIAIKFNPKWMQSFMRDQAGRVRISAQQIRYARRDLRECELLSASPDDTAWWSRAQDAVTNLAHNLGWFDDDGPRTYTEIDEIHEYGFVPDEEVI